MPTLAGISVFVLAISGVFKVERCLVIANPPIRLCAEMKQAVFTRAGDLAVLACQLIVTLYQEPCPSLRPVLVAASHDSAHRCLRCSGHP